jgi:predicted SnoaL-like aldol condensation-catalyzing enzyme
MMNKKITKLMTGAAMTTAVLASAGCFAITEDKEMSLSNTEKAVSLIRSIETGDQAPVAYINPEKYTQHNLAVGDGLAGFGAVLQALPKGSAKADVKRAFQDGEYVVLHTNYNFFGPKVGFDVFRFEEGLIVEHWDNLAEKAEPNPSGRTQLDGPTDIQDLDKTAANKQIVSGFVETILINGEMDKITDFIATGEQGYLQHNTAVGDGLGALGAALGALAEQGMPMVYTRNHKVLGQGNFVLSISEGQFLNEHVSFYDLFRLQEGKIVEHWDTIETIPAKAEWKNDNGKFGF